MPFLTQGNANWKFIGIVVILAVIAGGGILFYLQMMEEEFKMPPVYILEKEVEDETIDRQLYGLYMSDKYGFQIRYPNNWSQRELEEGNILVALRDFNRVNDFIIYAIEVSQEENLRDYLKEDFSKDSSKRKLTMGVATIGDQEEIELAGLSAVQREEFMVGKYSIMATYLKKNNLIFKFVFHGTEPSLYTVTEEDRELNDQIISTFKFIDKDIRCEESSKYFVILASRFSVSDFLVKYKTDKDQVIPCDYIVAEGDFEIKNQDATYFLALTDNFLLLDRGTAPPPRILIVYDLINREKVYTAKYSSHPSISNDTITYWTPTDEKVTEDNCPEINEFLGRSLGAEIEAYVTLNLTDLTKEESGEYRCSARQ